MIVFISNYELYSIDNETTLDQSVHENHRYGLQIINSMSRRIIIACEFSHCQVYDLVRVHFFSGVDILECVVWE